MRMIIPITKEDCLALMGVTVWKQRDLVRPCLFEGVNSITIYLLHDVKKASYLILVGQQGIGKNFQASDKMKLKNILKEMNWPLKECAFAEWRIQTNENTCLEDQLQTLEIQKVLVLGDCPNIDFHRLTYYH